MATLIRGDKLKATTREDVLRAYVHRNTREHPFPASGGDGKQTDAEWLRSHAFAVTRAGTLDSRHQNCFPAYLAHDAESAEEMTLRQKTDEREALEVVKDAVEEWQKTCNVSE